MTTRAEQSARMGEKLAAMLTTNPKLPTPGTVQAISESLVPMRFNRPSRGRRRDDGWHRPLLGLAIDRQVEYALEHGLTTEDIMRQVKDLRQAESVGIN